jgi:hypothetical protein
VGFRKFSRVAWDAVDKPRSPYGEFVAKIKKPRMNTDRHRWGKKAVNRPGERDGFGSPRVYSALQATRLNILKRI